MAENICLWGPSGSGKTGLLGTFAKGLYEATGKRTRLYTGDGGGWGTIGGLVDQGIVEAWDISEAKYPFERMRDATQGMWPENPRDPSSPLISAFIMRYEARCQKVKADAKVCGKLVYQGERAPDARAVLSCPDCKVPVVARAIREPNPKNGIQHIGAVMYEGLTAYGEMLLDNMSDRSARGEKMGEDVAVRFKDGEVEVGAISRSSYSIAQRRVKSAVQESRHLPVDYVFWTALKARGEDDERRVPVFGPKLVGKAATDDIPRWFGPSLGTLVVPLAQGKKEWRLYLSTFFETWNTATASIENVCNSRIPASQLNGVPEFYVQEPSKATLLWDVIKLIKERQGQFKAQEAAAGAKAPAVAATKVT